MLSQKTRYALKALILLAESGCDEFCPMTILDLANRGQLPLKFLEAILLELKKQGVLQSKKGKGGGYFLGKSADKVMIGEVIRALEGPLALLPCVSIRSYQRCEHCQHESLCGMRVLFKEVRDATAFILDGTSLEKICLVEKQLADQQAHMYFI